MDINKIFTAIIIAVIVSSGSLPTQHQLQALYQGGYWDGTTITTGSNSAEVKSDQLLINSKAVTEFRTYNTEVDVLAKSNLKENAELTKTLGAIIATHINTIGTDSLAPYQYQALFQSGLWDGSFLGDDTKNVIVEQGFLYLNNKSTLMLTPMDSAYPDYVMAWEEDIVAIISSTTKKTKGTWYANFTTNEIVFDSKGVRKITIKIPEEISKWQVDIPRNSKKYLYIHSNILHKDVARITIKTGKVKWY